MIRFDESQFISLSGRIFESDVSRVGLSSDADEDFVEHSFRMLQVDAQQLNVQAVVLFNDICYFRVHKHFVEHALGIFKYGCDQIRIRSGND